MKKTLYLSCLWLGFFCFSCSSSRKTFDPEKKYPLQALQGDYQLFRHILEQYHPSLYWYTTRDSMDHYFQQGFNQLKDSMTEPEFRTDLSYVISRIHCGHTAVRSSKQFERYLDTARSTQFPLILKCWKDTMVVAANLNRRDSLLKRGSIILSINGRSAGQLEDTLFNYIISDGYNLTGKYQYLSTGFHFSTLYRNVFGPVKTFDINYIDPADSNGQQSGQAPQIRQTTIALYDPRTDTIKRYFNKTPLADTEPHRRERKRMEEFYTRNLQIDSATRTAFMSLNTFEHGNHLVRFFRQSFKTMQQQHVANLVIDVRSNGGGDASNSTLLTRYITNSPFRVGDSLYAISRSGKYGRYIQKSLLYRMLMHVVTSKRADGKYHFGYFERHTYHPRKEYHFNGQVYILTGGNSFSATSLFAGALKGQKNVTLVGEETGGGYYGNSAWMIPDVTLPATGVRFRLPLFRLVVDRYRPKDGRGIPPDVQALPSVQAIIKGQDFKTARAKELIREREK